MPYVLRLHFRKILLLVVILLGLLTFIAYTLRISTKNSLYSVFSFTGFKQLSFLRSTSLSCNAQDEIGFLYYRSNLNLPVKNNKFGLYVYAERSEYLELAQKMVNSNGGDWGYVLIPYNVSDQNKGKWEGVFNRLIAKRLIPIIQLNDIDPDNYKEDTEDAAKFLNSFVWPIKQKYISVYNEPNDAKFWFGRVSPTEYARVLNYTIDSFKKRDKDFFILNGAFNVSARTGTDVLDFRDYTLRMNEEVPGIFDKLDGWASHSYPQPNFSGSPEDTGRDSIRAYEFELDYLKNNLGVKKELPVFITETGWAHAEGSNYNNGFLPVQKVADNFKQAFRDVWLKDDRVMAVTPFTIWFEPPFDHFAWVDRDETPYAQYQAIKDLKKLAGTPEKILSSRLKILNCI